MSLIRSSYILFCSVIDRGGVMVFNATLNNISVISWRFVEINICLHIYFHMPYIVFYNVSTMQERFEVEDPKWVISSRNSKNGIQYKGQKKNDKKTNKS